MPSYALGRELAGLKGTLGRAAYGAGVFTAPSWMPAIFNQGQSSSTLSRNIGRVPGMTPNPKTDIGRQAGNELQYIGRSLLSGQVPYTGPSQRAQQTGQYGRYAPPDTQERSWLYSSGAAQSPGAAPAAERAYQQEKSRVAQLTAQDPELQRYEEARKKAVAAGSGSAAEQSAENTGMQIWAKKYGKPGDLASRVKPGQSGYDVIQRTLNAGQMGAPAELPAFAGVQPSAYLGTSGAPSTSSYQGVKPATLSMGAIGPNALTNAYNMQTASQFTKFTEGPTLSSQPLGNPTASVGDIPTYSQLSSPQRYGFGSIQGEDEAFGTEAAQKLAQSYVKNLLNFSPR